MGWLDGGSVGTTAGATSLWGSMRRRFSGGARGGGFGCALERPWLAETGFVEATDSASSGGAGGLVEEKREPIGDVWLQVACEGYFD